MTPEKSKGKQMLSKQRLKWVFFVVVAIVVWNSTSLMKHASRNKQIVHHNPKPQPVSTGGMEGDPIRPDEKISIIVPVRHPLKLPLGILDGLDEVGGRIDVLFVLQDGRSNAEVLLEMKQSIASKKNVRLVVSDKADETSEKAKGSSQDESKKVKHHLLVKPFAELANLGASETTNDTNILIFLADFYLPTSSMLQRMVSLLQRSIKPGAVGCQLIQMPDSTLAGDVTSDPVIVEHGTEVALGRDDRGASTIFVSKNFNGYSIHDARAKTIAEETMVSPYCMATRRETFFKMKGFVSGHKNILQEIYGGGSNKALNTATERLRSSIIGMETVMEGVSIAQIQQTKNPLRALVRKSYKLAVESTSLWEKVVGTKWISTHKRPIMKSVVEKEKQFQDSISHLPVLDRLEAYQRVVESNMAMVSEYSAPVEELAWEEDAGWDYTLRLAAAGLKSYGSTGQAVLNRAFLPDTLDEYITDHPTFSLIGPSVAINGAFRKRWGEQLKLSHRSRKLHEEAPIKVVWDSFCCNCCGFSNEIVHLTFPLHKLHSVNIVPDPQCFCQGFPNAVMDSLRRNHLTKEQYLIDKATDDEIVVWISHTDPTSFQNRVFETRKPDYIVGRSMYEFSRIDMNWVIDANNNADEIWVPAEWVKNVFSSSGVNKDKLVVIPEAVDTYYFDPTAQRKVPLPPVKQKWRHWCNRPTPGNSTHQPYKFFSNFKWEDRKGWDIMFHAYYNAFKNDEVVSLYILTHIWFPGGPETYGDKHNITFLREEVLRAAQQWGVQSLDEFPHFCFVAHDLTESEVAQMYNTIDAFLLPTRGEGWGLPSIQAMAMGKPTISTNWGGQMEFLKPDYAFLIPLDGVEEIPEDSVYRWRFGKKWGIPSLKGTTELLQLVYNKQDEANEVGMKARSFIVEHFSEDALSRRIDKRLLEIREMVLAKRRDVEGLHQGGNTNH